jgi:hypothetical protein
MSLNHFLSRSLSVLLISALIFEQAAPASAAIDRVRPPASTEEAVRLFSSQAVVAYLIPGPRRLIGGGPTEKAAMDKAIAQSAKNVRHASRSLGRAFRKLLRPFGVLATAGSALGYTLQPAVHAPSGAVAQAVQSPDTLLATMEHYQGLGTAVVNHPWTEAVLHGAGPHNALGSFTRDLLSQKEIAGQLTGKVDGQQLHQVMHQIINATNEAARHSQDHHIVHITENLVREGKQIVVPENIQVGHHWIHLSSDFIQKATGLPTPAPAGHVAQVIHHAVSTPVMASPAGSSVDALQSLTHHFHTFLNSSFDIGVVLAVVGIAAGLLAYRYRKQIVHTVKTRPALNLFTQLTLRATGTGIGLGLLAGLTVLSISWSPWIPVIAALWATSLVVVKYFPRWSEIANADAPAKAKATPAPALVPVSAPAPVAKPALRIEKFSTPAISFGGATNHYGSVLPSKNPTGVMNFHRSGETNHYGSYFPQGNGAGLGLPRTHETPAGSSDSVAKNHTAKSPGSHFSGSGATPTGQLLNAGTATDLSSWDSKTDVGALPEQHSQKVVKGTVVTIHIKYDDRTDKHGTEKHEGVKPPSADRTDDRRPDDTPTVVDAPKTISTDDHLDEAEKALIAQLPALDPLVNGTKLESKKDEDATTAKAPEKDSPPAADGASDQRKSGAGPVIGAVVGAGVPAPKKSVEDKQLQEEAPDIYTGTPERGPQYRKQKEVSQGRYRVPRGVHNQQSREALKNANAGASFDSVRGKWKQRPAKTVEAKSSENVPPKEPQIQEEQIQEESTVPLVSEAAGETPELENNPPPSEVEQPSEPKIEQPAPSRTLKEVLTVALLRASGGLIAFTESREESTGYTGVRERTPEYRKQKEGAQGRYRVPRGVQNQQSREALAHANAGIPFDSARGKFEQHPPTTRSTQPSPAISSQEPKIYTDPVSPEETGEEPQDQIVEEVIPEETFQPNESEPPATNDVLKDALAAALRAGGGLVGISVPSEASEIHTGARERGPQYRKQEEGARGRYRVPRGVQNQESREALKNANAGISLELVLGKWNQRPVKTVKAEPPQAMSTGEPKIQSKQTPTEPKIESTVEAVKEILEEDHAPLPSEVNQRPEETFKPSAPHDTLKEVLTEALLRASGGLFGFTEPTGTPESYTGPTEREPHYQKQKEGARGRYRVPRGVQNQQSREALKNANAGTLLESERGKWKQRRAKTTKEESSQNIPVEEPKIDSEQIQEDPIVPTADEVTGETPDVGNDPQQSDVEQPSSSKINQPAPSHTLQDVLTVALLRASGGWMGFTGSRGEPNGYTGPTERGPQYSKQKEGARGRFRTPRGVQNQQSREARANANAGVSVDSVRGKWNRRSARTITEQPVNNLLKDALVDALRASGGLVGINIPAEALEIYTGARERGSQYRNQKEGARGRFQTPRGVQNQQSRQALNNANAGVSFDSVRGRWKQRPAAIAKSQDSTVVPFEEQQIHKEAGSLEETQNEPKDQIVEDAAAEETDQQIEQEHPATGDVLKNALAVALGACGGFAGISVPMEVLQIRPDTPERRTQRPQYRKLKEGAQGRYRVSRGVQNQQSRQALKIANAGIPVDSARGRWKQEIHGGQIQKEPLIQSDGEGTAEIPEMVSDDPQRSEVEQPSEPKIEQPAPSRTLQEALTVALLRVSGGWIGLTGPNGEPNGYTGPTERGPQYRKQTEGARGRSRAPRGVQNQQSREALANANAGVLLDSVRGKWNQSQERRIPKESVEESQAGPQNRIVETVDTEEIVRQTDPKLTATSDVLKDALTAALRASEGLVGISAPEEAPEIYTGTPERGPQYRKQKEGSRDRYQVPRGVQNQQSREALKNANAGVPFESARGKRKQRPSKTITAQPSSIASSEKTEIQEELTPVEQTEEGHDQFVEEGGAEDVKIPAERERPAGNDVLKDVLVAALRVGEGLTGIRLPEDISEIYTGGPERGPQYRNQKEGARGNYRRPRGVENQRSREALANANPGVPFSSVRGKWNQQQQIHKASILDEETQVRPQDQIVEEAIPEETIVRVKVERPSTNDALKGALRAALRASGGLAGIDVPEESLEIYTGTPERGPQHQKQKEGAQGRYRTPRGVQNQQSREAFATANADIPFDPVRGKRNSIIEPAPSEEIQRGTQDQIVEEEGIAEETIIQVKSERPITNDVLQGALTTALRAGGALAGIRVPEEISETYTGGRERGPQYNRQRENVKGRDRVARGTQRQQMREEAEAANAELEQRAEKKQAKRVRRMTRNKRAASSQVQTSAVEAEEIIYEEPDGSLYNEDDRIDWKTSDKNRQNRKMRVKDFAEDDQTVTASEDRVARGLKNQDVRKNTQIANSNHLFIDPALKRWPFRPKALLLGVGVELRELASRPFRTSDTVAYRAQEMEFAGRVEELRQRILKMTPDTLAGCESTFENLSAEAAKRFRLSPGVAQLIAQTQNELTEASNGLQAEFAARIQRLRAELEIATPEVFAARRTEFAQLRDEGARWFAFSPHIESLLAQTEKELGQAWTRVVNDFVERMDLLRLKISASSQEETAALRTEFRALQEERSKYFPKETQVDPSLRKIHEELIQVGRRPKRLTFRPEDVKEFDQALWALGAYISKAYDLLNESIAAKEQAAGELSPSALIIRFRNLSEELVTLQRTAEMLPGVDVVRVKRDLALKKGDIEKALSIVLQRDGGLPLWKLSDLPTTLVNGGAAHFWSFFEEATGNLRAQAVTDLQSADENQVHLYIQIWNRFEAERRAMAKNPMGIVHGLSSQRAVPPALQQQIARGDENLQSIGEAVWEHLARQLDAVENEIKESKGTRGRNELLALQTSFAFFFESQHGVPSVKTSGKTPRLDLRDPLVKKRIDGLFAKLGKKVGGNGAAMRPAAVSVPPLPEDIQETLQLLQKERIAATSVDSSTDLDQGAEDLYSISSKDLEAWTSLKEKSGKALKDARGEFSKSDPALRQKVREQWVALEDERATLDEAISEFEEPLAPNAPAHSSRAQVPPAIQEMVVAIDQRLDALEQLLWLDLAHRTESLGRAIADGVTAIVPAEVDALGRELTGLVNAERHRKARMIRSDPFPLRATEYEFQPGRIRIEGRVSDKGLHDQLDLQIGEIVKKMSGMKIPDTHFSLPVASNASDHEKKESLLNYLNNLQEETDQAVVVGIGPLANPGVTHRPEYEPSRVTWSAEIYEECVEAFKAEMDQIGGARVNGFRPQFENDPGVKRMLSHLEQNREAMEIKLLLQKDLEGGKNRTWRAGVKVMSASIVAMAVALKMASLLMLLSVASYAAEWRRQYRPQPGGWMDWQIAGALIATLCVIIAYRAVPAILKHLVHRDVLENPGFMILKTENAGSDRDAVGLLHEGVVKTLQPALAAEPSNQNLQQVLQYANDLYALFDWIRKRDGHVITLKEQQKLEDLERAYTSFGGANADYLAAYLESRKKAGLVVPAGDLARGKYAALDKSLLNPVRELRTTITTRLNNFPFVKEDPRSSWFKTIRAGRERRAA